MELTCIMCPVGCTLKVEKNGELIVVTGNACPRGEEYGKKEVVAPERIVTTVKRFQTGTICLKTNVPIPKKLIDEILRKIASEKIPQKIKVGDIFIKNILGTNSDIMVTKINL